MPITASASVETFQTANGKQWRLAGTDDNGLRYFVPAHLEPANVLRLAWAKETDLAEALGPLTPIAVCRCDDPDVDPYECEADDCTYSFSELNPFGQSARPVNVGSAEVSRKCGTCGWKTSVWHVDDGSADQELHEHISREHTERSAA
ncbi:hypothetical protein ACFV10_28505 [Streptomyces cyaneofuscatus]|uniref:hypothetical protein n=1 Tax=Streptomyces cyaneofuscatus TaxID=66883 RepID=UPI0036ADE232